MRSASRSSIAPSTACASKPKKPPPPPRTKPTFPQPNPTPPGPLAPIADGFCVATTLYFHTLAPVLGGEGRVRGSSILMHPFSAGPDGLGFRTLATSPPSRYSSQQKQFKLEQEARSAQRHSNHGQRSCRPAMCQLRLKMGAEDGLLPRRSQRQLHRRHRNRRNQRRRHVLPLPRLANA